MGVSRLVNRNITAAAGRTSMRLEPEIWEALREICLRENKDLKELIRTVEDSASGGGRTSAVRVHVLQYFRAAATCDGHLLAGHGLFDTGPAMGGMGDDASDGDGASLHERPSTRREDNGRAAFDA